MVPTPSITAPGQVQVNAPPVSLRSWLLGQLLTATVLETPAPGRALLNVGGQQVQAETTLPLAKGQTLTLQVSSLGRQPVLELVQSPVEEHIDPQQAALKVNLPRQAPIPPLLESITEALSASPQARPPLPAPVITAIAKWVAKLPDAAALVKPSTLKQALQDSGLFLEAHLAASPAPATAQDLKGNLLKLAAVLVEQAAIPATPPSDPPPSTASAAPTSTATGTTGVPEPPAAPTLPQVASPATSNAPMPHMDATAAHHAAASSTDAPPATPAQQAATIVKDLSQQVGAALARIEMHQLHNLAATEHTQPLWIFELPVRDRQRLDLVQMKIERHQQRSGNRFQKAWSLTVSTDLAGLGPMHARVSLTGTNEIRTTVWAEKPQTLQLVETHRGWLQDQFRAVGLNSLELQCLAGRPAQSKEPKTGPLVDLQV